ncbi:MAG TPA: hypothetical protein VF721_00570 [Pyrinomonadaceae bacterium]|jgi:ppGpp synthetase/RelA/SpoT-type nucleotidyltranferase
MATNIKKQARQADNEEAAQTFKQNERFYERLQEEALFTLKEEIDKTEIKIHSIPSRIKELDSFLKKISLYQIEKPFEDINDIVGLRVICLFLTDIEKIGNVIRNTFDVVKEDNKIDNSKFASFGYLSVHFIAKLGKNFRGTRYNNILDIPFEIQVRTIAMDAWANISHYLDYKTDKDIPEELKRDFYALSGMFYVADKHFQLFFDQRQEKNEEITEIFEKGQEEDINSQPINLDTLKIFLREKLPDYEVASDYSPLVQDLTQAGFKTIGEINSLLEKSRKATELYIQDVSLQPPITDNTFCCVAINFNNYDFHKLFMRRYLKSDYEISVDDWRAINREYMDLIEK